ncbi:hypothetical protein PISMIDRAFT_464699 [Pisolithus microcarpus 441]|uniref:Uncharacterized protein n=1 Tax=Pisolithus microcarpus 441 TaxID=765257 RepID=A0A0C9YW38_9AGAM|nr:hypothetical protein BKA83DRAFT_464699 [Pisolithus microcarpus]KIK12098.1 hypothetical protein PISMIDRAFT_464699 [Pisolithus microcarpus 441]
MAERSPLMFMTIISFFCFCHCYDLFCLLVMPYMRPSVSHFCRMSRDSQDICRGRQTPTVCKGYHSESDGARLFLDHDGHYHNVAELQFQQDLQRAMEASSLESNTGRTILEGLWEQPTKIQCHNAFG